MATTSVKITGNVTEALAALDALGIRAETVGRKVEKDMGGAATRTGGLFQKLGGFGAGLALPFSESFTKIGDKLKDTEVKGGSLGKKLAGLGQAAVLGLGAAAAVVGTVGVEAAVSAQKVEAQLKTAIDNTGASFDKFEPKILSADSQMRKFGFTNTDTNTALTTLTVALGSPAKALGVMQTAADLARMKNMSLNDSALLVAKAMEGQTRPLKALGIDLPVYAGGAHNVQLAQLALAKAQAGLNGVLAKAPDAINPASKAHAAYEKALAQVKAAQLKLHEVQGSGSTILKALTEKVHGAAAAYGKTLAGQVAQARAQLDNVAERIGAALIPVMTRMMSIIASVVGWFERHKTVALALGLVIGGVLVAAVGAYTLAMLPAAAATIAAAAPVLAIGVAIAALVAAALLLVRHWRQVWHDIKAWAEDGWKFIKAGFDWLVHAAIWPIKMEWKLFSDAWTATWDVIKTAGQAAWGFLNNYVFHPIKTAFDTLTGWISTAATTVGGIFSHFWDGLLSAGKAIFNAVAGIWNDTIGSLSFHIPSWVPVIGGDGFSMPKIPTFDVGGFVPGPIGAPLPAIVHGGEFVVSNAMMAGRAPMPAAATSGRGGPAPQVTINAGANPGASDIAQAVLWGLRGLGYTGA